jgi:hypothetical protein
MNDDEKKSGAPDEQSSEQPASAAPILIGFAVCAALLVLVGWLTQP